MQAKERVKVLSVRLPESGLRHLKVVAASRGVNIQEAVREALDLWASHKAGEALLPLQDLRGSLAGVDVQKLRREEKDRELVKDRRKSNAASHT